MILTYKVIEYRLLIGRIDEHFKIGSLFYMDDGTIFAENLGQFGLRLTEVNLK